MGALRRNMSTLDGIVDTGVEFVTSSARLLTHVDVSSRVPGDFFQIQHHGPLDSRNRHRPRQVRTLAAISRRFGSRIATSRYGSGRYVLVCSSRDNANRWRSASSSNRRNDGRERLPRRKSSHAAHRFSREVTVSKRWPTRRMMKMGARPDGRPGKSPVY